MNYSYEITKERIRSVNVNFDGNQFERMDGTDRVNYTARVLQDGKISIANGSKPNSADALIKKAAEMVRYGSPHEVPFVGKTDITPLALTDPRTLSPKEMIERMGDFVEELRKLDARLVVSAGLSQTETETEMKTDSGFDAGFAKTVWRCGFSLELMQEDDQISIWDGESNIGPDFDFDKFRDMLAQKLEHAKTVTDFTPGAYPVIFVPDEAGYLVRPIVACLDGNAIYRKVSPWADKLGEKLLDSRLTLTDEGAINAYPCTPFDKEGTPTRSTTLVEEGVIKDILTNRKVAQLLNRESSGNASPYGIGPHYLHLNPGTKSLNALIADIDYGMIVESSMGAWSGNPYGGIVSGTISLGFKIEKGKIAGRVKNCMYTVNAFEHFNKHLRDCSAERTTDGGMVGTACLPHILLDEVVISTKS